MHKYIGTRRIETHCNKQGKEKTSTQNCWWRNASRVKYTSANKSFFLPFCYTELTVGWRCTEHAFIERNQDTQRWKRIMFRSSCSQMFFKISVLKNLVILIRKHLCWSLFFKTLQACKDCNFIKKSLRYSCFPVNIAKFLWT